MRIKIVTILGANGTMGRNVAAIFASFGDARVYLVCRDIEKSRIALEKTVHVVKSASIANNLIAATYNDLEKIIPISDLIFESVAEDIEVKKAVLTNIKPLVRENTIIGTGTSGLSIKQLSTYLGNYSNNFFGIHMFNPPYSLSLCELVVHDKEQQNLAECLKEYLHQKLERSVIQVKDSPSFLGNRIGFFFINECLKLAEENMNQGGIDYIDTIFGCFTGRNMAPLVTSDFVGLDVHESIVNYINSESDDDFNDFFMAPDYLNELVVGGNHGRKVNKGLYSKNRDTNEIFVYDIKEKKYRQKKDYQFYFANEMLQNIKVGNYKEAINALLTDDSKEANICKKLLLQYIVYALKMSLEVSRDISDCDIAMATGFSWIPPIALIELFGGKSMFRKLVHTHLDARFVNALTDDIYQQIPKCSVYDYRPFFKAKY